MSDFTHFLTQIGKEAVFLLLIKKRPWIWKPSPAQSAEKSTWKPSPTQSAEKSTWKPSPTQSAEKST